MNAKIIETLLRASLVKRYHTHTTLREDTVGRHSSLVAWLCYYLADREPSAGLLMAALQHDVPEAMYGDIPSPAKRLLDTEALRQAEAALFVVLEQPNFVEDLDDHERLVLKAADNLEGMLYTGYEVFYLGNRTLLPVFKKYSLYVDEGALAALPVVNVVRNAINAFLFAKEGGL